MNAPQLPAYLQNRRGPVLNDKAVEGLGSSLPPHISIQGNTFTLIDKTGNEQAAGPTLDAAIIDISDVVCKRYYGGKKWEPDSKDPPVCWSANGSAPSREAPQPQSPTCAACPQNVRGSATSAMSGAAIKACRDEKWLALLIPAYPTMLFQLVLTPGSFATWKSFVETAKSSGVDLGNVVTRISFQPKVNGVLTFQATAYIPEAIADARDKVLDAKMTDVLVGRNDVPRQGVLAAPAQQQALPPVQNVSTEPTANPAFGGQASTQAPFGAPAATSSPIVPATDAPFAITGSTAEQPVSQQRKRRTKAEMQAATGQPADFGGPGAANTGFGGAPAGGEAAPMAPFRPAPQQSAQGSGAPAGAPANTFGMEGGVAPNPELANMLQGLFATK